MNEAVESVVVSESVEDVGTPVPARVPGAFIVDLLEDTGMMDRGESELLLSIFEWVEVEARGFPDLLEGLCRLRGAVMKAAAVGEEAPERDGTRVPSPFSVPSRDQFGDRVTDTHSQTDTP